MIVICEPTCKSFSHEKINEGFLYVLNKLHNKDKILFLAHKSHWEILTQSLNNNNIDISRIEFQHINITSIPTLSILFNLFLIFKLKNKSIKKMVFLSTSKSLLFCLKHTLSINVEKFFVLHGELEELRDNIVIDNKYHDRPKEKLHKKLLKLDFNIFYTKAKSYFNIIDPFYHILKKYSFKKLIEKNHDDNFHYLVISKHIFNNLKNKLNVDNFNIDYIHYPQLSYRIEKQSNNNYPKFAIFGYGDSKMLYNLNLILKEFNIQTPFEIRIIGMDNRATSSFPWVTFPSNGKTLSRKKMEVLLKDIDFNLILYTKERYSLSCSASIIEAIQYCQPIIHLENPCISYYNENESLGYECPDLFSMANKIKEIVLSYNQEKINIENFKFNLNKKRLFLSPDNQIQLFKKVFNA